MTDEQSREAIDDESLPVQLKALVEGYKGEKEAWDKERRGLEAQLVVLGSQPPPGPVRRLSWNGAWVLGVACVGWAVLVIYALALILSGVGVLSAYLRGVDYYSIPYDPVAGTKRTGLCSERSGDDVCIEMPTEQALHDASGHAHYHTRVLFWNSTRDVSTEAALKRMAHKKASGPIEVHTTRGPANLVDLRSSMMRRITRGEHDFTCATFFGFPIDYCMLLLNSSSEDPHSYRVWIDVVGNVRPTRFSYDTIITEVKIASGLCEHAGSGQSPHHTAKYFKAVCFVYTNLLGQHDERCVSGSDAAVVQQLYEMQWGMLSCCDDPGRLARLLSRMRSDAV